MDVLFFTWGVALLVLLVVEKLCQVLQVPSDPAKIVLFVTGVIVLVWLVVVLAGIDIGGL